MKIETGSTSISIRTENPDDQYLLGRIAVVARSQVYAIFGGQRETTIDTRTVLNILAGLSRVQ